MGLTLYLLNKKAYKVLQRICKEDYTGIIDQVVLGRDSGLTNDYAEEIETLCETKNIPCFNRNQELVRKSEYSLAIGWRWLIHEYNNLIVLHDSLLPKYRGFSPLVNMLINGEKRIGVSALWATSRMDEGEIIYQSSLNITYPIKIGEAIDLISPLYADIVIKILHDLKMNKDLSSKAQLESEATYSLWRNDDDYFINWTDSAERIQRFIDAVGYPYAGAKTRIAGSDEILRIKSAEIVRDKFIENRDVGKVLFMENGQPTIVCGEGLIKLTHIECDGLPYHFKNFRVRLQ